MATQLLQTEFHPAPLHTRPNIRVAFSAGAATLAVRDKAATKPEADSTLDEIAARSPHANTPLRTLLAERNAIMARMNDGPSLSDADAAAVWKQITAIETELLGRDALTPDDAIVKLIAAAQVAAEGHELEDTEAAGAILQARRHFGIGYVHRQLLDALPAVEPVAASPAGIGSELAALIAEANRVNQIGVAYDRDVYGPASDRAETALDEADATLPHTTVNVWPSVTGDQITWTTAEPMDVATAKRVVGLGREGEVDSPEYIRAARRIVAADFWRKRALVRVERAHDMRDLCEKSNANWQVAGDAQSAVAAHPVTTAADLRAKLTFMVEREMGDGVDWTAELLADAERVAGTAGVTLEADSAILDAFAARRREFVASFDSDMTSEEESGYFSRMEAYEATILNTPATTIAGTVAKLRITFMHTVALGWTDWTIIDPTHPDFVAGLAEADLLTQGQWSAIEDLARIGGVNLAEQGL